MDETAEILVAEVMALADDNWPPMMMLPLDDRLPLFRTAVPSVRAAPVTEALEEMAPEAIDPTVDN